MERRLAAILAVDVVGYTRLMGADEAGTLARLKALRGEVIDPEIARHNGRIVKLMGDGALVEFASVVDAVACAAAIQRANATREADPAAGEVKLRFTSDGLEPLVSSGLRLLTPKSHHFLNSSFANMPRQRKAQGRPLLEMNPSDAAERGLIDGQSVVLSNERGEIRTALSVTDVIGAGAVALAGKWWSEPAETSAMANLLSPSSWSPGGQPAYNDTFVEVDAAEPS